MRLLLLSPLSLVLGGCALLPAWHDPAQAWIDLARDRMLSTGSTPAAQVHALARLQWLCQAGIDLPELRIAPVMNAVIVEAQNRDLKQQMLSAQVQATAFYERLGFSLVSEEFLEAGIPHVDMVRHSA